MVFLHCDNDDTFQNIQDHSYQCQLNRILVLSIAIDQGRLPIDPNHQNSYIEAVYLKSR